MQGGASIGKTVFDDCEVAQNVPEVLFGLPLLNTTANANSWTPLEYCHQDSGFVPYAKALASYMIENVGVQLSAAFQSNAYSGNPGTAAAANYNAPNTVVAPALGRSLAGNAQNVTINLVAPGSLGGDRLNQLDVRVGKTLKYGRTKSLIALDVYNVTNANPVQQYITTYGATFLKPTLILPGRFFKVSAQFDF